MIKINYSSLFELCIYKMYKWRCFNGNILRGSFTATGLRGTGTRTSTTCLKEKRKILYIQLAYYILKWKKLKKHKDNRTYMSNIFEWWLHGKIVMPNAVYLRRTDSYSPMTSFLVELYINHMIQISLNFVTSVIVKISLLF